MANDESLWDHLAVVILPHESMNKICRALTPAVELDHPVSRAWPVMDEATRRKSSATHQVLDESVVQGWQGSGR